MALPPFIIKIIKSMLQFKQIFHQMGRCRPATRPYVAGGTTAALSRRCCRCLCRRFCRCQRWRQRRWGSGSGVEALHRRTGTRAGTSSQPQARPTFALRHRSRRHALRPVRTHVADRSRSCTCWWHHASAQPRGGPARRLRLRAQTPRAYH